MTVKELLDILKDMSKTAEVFLGDYDEPETAKEMTSVSMEITHVEKRKVYKQIIVR